MTRRLRRPFAAALAVVASLAAVLALALARARRSARGVPLSPLTAGRRVGPDYVERRGIAADAPVPPGEVDDVRAYARPGFDPAALHPEVRRFYERTGEFGMVYRVRWHRGFRIGAALAARLTSRVEQLNLPGPATEAVPRRLRSRFVAVDPSADPREGARAWVRTDPHTGEAVFVAIYATHERDGERYANVAVPLPGCNLSTVLRVRSLDASGDEAGGATAGGAGIELTTRAPGDPGLYLATPLCAFALPLAQRFRVWPAGTPGAPPDVTGGDAALVAAHEMWAFGRQFLTIEYAITREGSTG